MGYPWKLSNERQTLGKSYYGTLTRDGSAPARVTSFHNLYLAKFALLPFLLAWQSMRDDIEGMNKQLRYT